MLLKGDVVLTNLHGQIAIVTGASRERGIGTAICRTLAHRGADVFFTHFVPFDETTVYGADESWPLQLEQELLETGVRVGQMSLDLSAPDAVEILLNRVEATLGQPTVLVNNATHCQEVSYKELTKEILDMHYAVNVAGTCLLSSEFVKRYGATSAKRIINFVSGQDKSPVPGNIAYVTTKGAISTFTKCFAREVAALGVTVNAIDPGPTDSGWMSGEVKQFLLPKFPMDRIGQPEDAARLVAFLAGEDAGWITGQIIHSDGGFWD